MAELEVFEDIRYRYSDGAVAKGRHPPDIRDDVRASLKIPSGRNYSAKGDLIERDTQEGGFRHRDCSL